MKVGIFQETLKPILLNNRPNWINFVRSPIERLVSLLYYHKCVPSELKPVHFLKRYDPQIPATVDYCSKIHRSMNVSK